MRLVAVLMLLALSVPARAQDTPHSESATAALVAGVDAFKAGHYAEAEGDFQSAVDAEPNWRTAHVYLGTALAYQVVPNLDTAENVAVANRALDQFNQILASDPRDLVALRQIASIQRNVKRFDDALATERRIIAVDPKDAEAHYTIGVIDWTNAYKFAVLTLGRDSLQDDGNGNAHMSAATCAALVSHNGPLVDEGIGELKRAVEIRPAYNDAMQYLNLTYRRRADLDCDNPAQRAKDLETANEWVRRAIVARKANEQRLMQQAGESPSKQ